MADARAHQIVDACAQREERFLADDTSEPRVALATEFRQRGAELERRCVDGEHRARW